MIDRRGDFTPFSFLNNEEKHETISATVKQTRILDEKLTNAQVKKHKM